jgi:molecular chaperone Hsp33
VFGDNAQMAITLEAPNRRERYQSLIPLEGDTLAQALEAYFSRSEQLPTRLWLTTNEHTAAGMLLQRLPREHTSDENWERASLLLDTLTPNELMELEAETLLYRLFHEEEPRLFDPSPIHFHCDCSRERVETLVQSLGQEEAHSIVEEQGKIQITCEFCNASYTLDAIEVTQLFRETIPGNDSVH